MTRAPFFSLDGLDGAGKSTQCRMLAEWLRGRGIGVTECSDPGGTEIGRLLRSFLLDHRREMTMTCEAFLFMASRAQLMAEVVRPALGAGRAVVCDRFLLANVVYQGHAGGLDVDQLWAMGRLSSDGLEPDVTFVLDLSIEEALARRKGPADRVEIRDSSYHMRVRDGFRKEAERSAGRIVLIDASKTVEEVHAQIRTIAAKWLGGNP
jgi:dTMP kinase